MKKYFIPMQHTHSCVAGLYFHGGNIVENRENRGISHLLEHMIFRRLDTLKMKELYRNLNRQRFDLPDSMICFAKTLQKAKENLSEKDREEVIGFHTFQPGLWDDSCEYNQYIAESVFTQGSSVYEVKEIIRQYENVTVEELKQLANEIFTPENMSISVGYDSWYTKKSTLEKKCRKMRKILGGQYL